LKIPKDIEPQVRSEGRTASEGRLAAVRAKERQALGWLVIAALAAIVWLALPFATGLLLGAVMAFMLEPLYRSLVRRKGHHSLAAFVIVLLSGVVVVGAIGGFVTLFVTRVAAFAQAVSKQLSAGGPYNDRVETITRWLGHFGISGASLLTRLEAGAGEIASRSATLAASLASGTFLGFLSLLFALLAMYVVLRYWARMVSTLELISPLYPSYTRALLAEFRRVGRQTISGTVFTGLAQGAIAAIGFWITGVPDALFFGVATAIASLIPAIGTLLVWVPAGVYLLATGHTGRAIIEFIWGALMVVGLSDYVIRPRLVGDAAIPALLVFLALFGGVYVMGLAGLIVGPVLMQLAVAVLRLYLREQRAQRAAP
jgi:predicted PurR-regulated permease PerM